MDSSSFEEFVLDPSKCNNLSIEEKREIVYELAKLPDGAPEMLLSWSRRDILEILCTEMGKERKYTGLTKLKIIENLMKIVSEKISPGNENENSPDTNSTPSGQRDTKMQRKNEDEYNVLNVIYCKNSACKANLSYKDRFCRRCSCCICRKFDDNKDTSLWLTCCSDPPYFGNSCGLSSHLECALRSGKSGIGKDGMDGNFLCVSCGKLNDMLGCWRKQMITAKETRRVDILCYRISLTQKLLSGTKRYQKPYEIITEAKNSLEHEVGPLTGPAVKMARGIVNRLSSGPEVQRLCGLALESLDSIISGAGSQSLDQFVQEPNPIPSNPIHLQEVTSSSVTIILDSKDSRFGNVLRYTIWHRKAEDIDYMVEPTCMLATPYSTFLLSGLTPSTNYIIKVISFDESKELGTFELHFQTSNVENEVPNLDNGTVVSNQSPTTISSCLSNPSSVEEETNNITPNIEKEKANVLVKGSELCSLNMETREVPLVTTNDADLPITPCKLEIIKKNIGTKPNKSGSCSLEMVKVPQVGSSTKKRKGRDEESLENADSDFEYCVNVIRWLECEGHIEMEFRKKLLTWYSLEASPQEMRVVKVFINTLIDDPRALAGQLVDTFSCAISNKRSSGFCMKLWH